MHAINIPESKSWLQPTIKIFRGYVELLQNALHGGQDSQEVKTPHIKQTNC